MLPSGNDAALVLAYYYGYWLGRSDRFPNYTWNNAHCFSLEGKKKYFKIYLSRFMSYMNNKLVKDNLEHRDTHFENPHGLPDKLQKSTAWEVVHAAMIFLADRVCEI
jgi:D-alanyl-D-alanine carboxypeptidase